MSNKRCENCGSPMGTLVDGKFWCQPCRAVEVAKIKPPIYPVEVIEVACRALEALKAVSDASLREIGFRPEIGCGNEDTIQCAMRIIRDGLASHEKAIRGEP